MLQNILAYTLKVIICSGLMMLYYSLALRNRRFHHYNRIYLLISVLLSITLPILHLQWFTLNSSSAQAIHVFNIIDSKAGEEMNSSGASFFSRQQFWIYAFLLIGLLMMMILAGKTIKIFRLKKKFPVTSMAGFDFVVTDLQHAPFSFFRNIFWRSDIDLDEETGKQILQHEITHVRQKHSWDKLFLQLIFCFYWINPFFWWLRKELYLIHEFIADEKAVINNDTESFAKMMLTAHYKKFDLLPAQSFFYSPIKRRLLMLTNSKKTPFSYLRRLMLLPLIVVVVCLFAFTVKKESPASSQQKIIASRPFVLVVDAGHGGKDFGARGFGINEKDIALTIAQAIKKLSQEYGIDVVLTRNDDVFMSPQEKSDFANAQHADAFISLHVNAAGTTQQERSGFEVVLSRNNAQEFSSVLLGSAILQSLQTDFKITPSLQQKQQGIWVLENSIIPAALIECGYITNSDDTKMLKDDAKIEMIAREILNGAALYANNKNSISSKDVVNHDKDTSVPAQINSMSPAQTPLYVLDGKIISKEQADKLDPSLIEKINVLKGKDATGKYGDRGKNGVAEITSKKKANEPSVPPPPPPDPPTN